MIEMVDIINLSDTELLDKHENNLTWDCAYPDLSKAETKKRSDASEKTEAEILRRLALNSEPIGDAAELLDQVALHATGGIDEILKEGKVPAVIVYLDQLRIAVADLQADAKDLQMVCGIASEVYCHITGGNFSKPNTLASHIIAAYEDEVNKQLAESEALAALVPRLSDALEKYYKIVAGILNARSIVPRADVDKHGDDVAKLLKETRHKMDVRK